MDGEDLLVLKENPSFEGELSVRLIEEHGIKGRAKYFIICQKNPPLNGMSFLYLCRHSVGVVGRDSRGNNEEHEVAARSSTLEAKIITAILEHQFVHCLRAEAFNVSMGRPTDS